MPEEFKFPVKLLGNLIAVEKVQLTMTEGGLHLPHNADSGLPRVRVVAVGPGKRNSDGVILPMRVEVGDIVFLTGAMPPISLPVHNRNYFILPEESVIGIVTDESAFQQKVTLPENLN